MKKSARVLRVSIFVVLSAIFLISVSFGIEFPAKEQPTTPTVQPGIKPPKIPTKIPIVKNCQIDGIREIMPSSPNKVKFQVQYFIPTSWPGPYFISAKMPNPNFSIGPAGRLPNGVPKGQHSFADNIVVEVVYKGTQTTTTSTIEVYIYDDKGQIFCTKIFNWSHTWSPPPPEESCRIDGINEIQSSPNVLLQVAYYIPTSWTGAYYIHGHVPNNANRNQNILDRAAGTNTNGVPKGQQSFTNNVVIDLGYNGSQQLTTSTIEILIMDGPSCGKIYCSKILNWTHTWMP
jgi:hypothetical protein